METEQKIPIWCVFQAIAFELLWFIVGHRNMQSDNWCVSVCDFHLFVLQDGGMEL